MRKIALALLCCTALTATAGAAEPPRAGQRDPTMRTQAYRADSRTQIIGTLRRSTTITFGQEEAVVRVILGDDDILEGPDPSTLGSSPLKNHLPLWPKKAGRTNFQVITSAPGRPDRLYQFVMIVREPPADGGDDPEATYGLTFTYPGQRSPAQEADRVARQEREETARAVARLRSPPSLAQSSADASAGDDDGYRNFRFIARGDRALAPVAIGDDGVMTYFLFHPSFPVPSVFWMPNSQEERTVMLERQGQMFVASGVYEVLRFRSGSQVLDIHNVGYAESLRQLNAWQAEQRGTARRGVTREIRRGQAR